MPKQASLHNEVMEAAYEGNPVAAGPMKLVRPTLAQRMEFERFEDFYYQPKQGVRRYHRGRWVPWNGSSGASSRKSQPASAIAGAGGLIMQTRSKNENVVVLV